MAEPGSSRIASILFAAIRRRAFAIRLSQEGYAITAVARNEARLTGLLDDLDGGPHEILAVDLSDSEGLKRCTDRLREKSHRVLVNNAGPGQFGNCAEAPESTCRNSVRG